MVTIVVLRLAEGDDVISGMLMTSWLLSLWFLLWEAWCLRLGLILMLIMAAEKPNILVAAQTTSE